ncbi:MAG: alkaline phosphatase family protein, partial [Phycisphaerae bacterium]
ARACGPGTRLARRSRTRITIKHGTQAVLDQACRAQTRIQGFLMPFHFSVSGRARRLRLAVVLLTLASWGFRPVQAADLQAPAAVSVRSKVVVVVMDGLRPDSVTAQDMPNLYRLSQEGVFFAHHHPVYLSSTEVNGTALATGAYPRHNGLMANKEYRPTIELIKPISTEEAGNVSKGDALSHGRYLLLPTMAEIAEQAGLSAIVAGTKPVALLLQRAPRSDGAKPGITVAQGKILPAGQQQDLEAAENAIPGVADATKSANAAQDAWTTRVLIKRLWAQGKTVPDLTMLWLSEPDYAQHGSGPGSATALAALKSSDDNLGIMLKTLEASGLRDTTDVLVVSDHGFSTVRRAIDLVDLLQTAKFNALSKMAKKPVGDEVLVVGNGGSVCLYIPSHDEKLTRRLVSYLQTTDFAGTIFTRTPMDGTFGLDQVWIDTAAAPEIVVSMRWSAVKSATGVVGLIDSEGLKRGPGQGNHTSLSRFDMHNTLVASGPDFRRGYVDELPSGNSDVAPTVLHILGLKPAAGMDGRILREAFVHVDAKPPVAQFKTLVAKVALEGGAMWLQYLKVTQVNATVYFDEGNAGTEPAATATEMK